ncbi:MAG: hypothetical protein IRY91_08340 [Gemmatimonadaceae bacterium]|nr:hypothetical protein [Gemmatimonadaceae bacterium]
MAGDRHVCVAVNGYGVIGKRVADCTPKGIAATNRERYRAAGVKGV